MGADHKTSELPVFDDDDETKPITLMELAAVDPDAPVTVREALKLHKRIALHKRTSRDTEEIERRVTKLEFPVRIMWAVSVFVASLAGASLITAVKVYGSAVSDAALYEYKLKSIESETKSVSDSLRDALGRLRDTEESVRTLALKLDEYLHRDRDEAQRRSNQNTRSTP